jgi:type IV pilus assembly protein PilE
MKVSKAMNHAAVLRSTANVRFLIRNIRSSHGFTLVELMVSMLIIAILAGTAIPSYDNYLVIARRSEAKTVMMKGALWMERNQAASFGYDRDAAGAALNATSLTAQGLGRSPESLNTTAYYLMTLATPVSSGAFEIAATAQGSQATKDSKCAVLITDHLGRRGIRVGSTRDYTSAQAASCWAS